MVTSSFLVFIIIGVLHGSLYAFWGDDIFGFNTDNLNSEKDFGEIKERIKKAPKAWRLEHFLHRFMGVFTGWMLLWFLLDKRLKVFSGQNISSPTLEDILLFLLSYIGINGRLPSIPHTVDKWFGSIFNRKP